MRKILNKIMDAITTSDIKVQELESLKADFTDKGYNYLWQIPDGPKKDRWIQLMHELGVPVQDNAAAAKPVLEVKEDTSNIMIDYK